MQEERTGRTRGENSAEEEENRETRLDDSRVETGMHAQPQTGGAGVQMVWKWASGSRARNRRMPATRYPTNPNQTTQLQPTADSAKGHSCRQ